MRTAAPRRPLCRRGGGRGWGPRANIRETPRARKTQNSNLGGELSGENASPRPTAAAPTPSGMDPNPKHLTTSQTPAGQNPPLIKLSFHQGSRSHPDLSKSTRRDPTHSACRLCRQHPPPHTTTHESKQYFLTGKPYFVLCDNPPRGGGGGGLQRPLSPRAPNNESRIFNFF